MSVQQAITPFARWSRRITRAVLLPALLISAVAGHGAPASGASESLTIEVLSNRADLVSGGDALVDIGLPTGANPAAAVVALDGRDVTEAFAIRSNGHLQGVVTELALGRNVLTATLPDGAQAALEITNHPLGGPIFSGPQITPWYCLAGAQDEQCNRPTTFAYLYKSSVTGQFAAYNPASPPLDLATTTNDQGVTVPYIVRVETGNMDRSQYRIAVLAEPDGDWTRWTGPPAWNHKVYVPHGAGCGMGHSEGPAPDVMIDEALSQGFAVMSTALEHNTENCNVVVQAESVMMAKEHLIETYGDIRYLFGTGCSGGSIAQLHMANAYPGLYDGLTVSCTYPDIPTLDLLDCPALLSYWDDPSRWGSGVVWTETQQAAAAGLASTSVCRSWVDVPVLNFSNMFDPRVGVACDVPQQQPELVYDPETNPEGVRCTFQDYLVNIFGTRPPDRWGPVEKQIGQGFANRPYDNVGIQYGLRALQAGQISPAQFVDLNAKVGGMDIDYGWQPNRVEADPGALGAVYRSGVLNEGTNLDRVPIIDLPIPGDRYEIHDNYKSWALRARLDEANGHHDNHVLWYGPDRGNAFDVMDDWLEAIEADGSDLPLEQKVVANRPEAAVDRCETPNRDVCDTVFGPAGSIRWASGGSIATDVVKCQIKQLRPSDYYPILFTDAEWEQLEAAFPSGVCDWRMSGVAQQPVVAWQTYQDGPGGRPLGPAPVAARTIE